MSRQNRVIQNLSLVVILIFLSLGILIHPNINASFEYEFRPSQSVVIANNPLTGLPVALSPFHAKTAVAGLKFVY